MLKKDLVDRVAYLEQQLYSARKSTRLLRESNEAANTSLRTRIAIKLSQFDSLSWAVPPGCSEEDLMAVADRAHHQLQDKIDEVLSNQDGYIISVKEDLNEYILKYNSASEKIERLQSKLNKYATYIADTTIDQEALNEAV